MEFRKTVHFFCTIKRIGGGEARSVGFSGSGKIGLAEAIHELVSDGGLVEAVETLKMDVNINYSMDIITANAVWPKVRGLGGFSRPSAEAGAGAEISGSLVLPGFTARGSGA